ncbi:hypothetical protein [Petrocella sp. FN5]|uniref:hypothetical protein n=1 Tax=Petrocella sp. FN5 TaxID=3032002 RepID=UPI0023DC90C4|nr:hypothetical protein [Petrocella sp. FN5]MDF1617790.1 hypothetical protein [Petrocella sp. FN5]
MINHPLYKRQEGSSSILVIILMVVMMVFGLAVLTTSLSNKRLAEKKQDWLHDYYDLEGLVEEKIGKIDQILLGVEEEAIDYISNGTYPLNLTVDTHLELLSKEQTFSYIYMELLKERLSGGIKGDKSLALYMSDYDFDDIENGYVIKPSFIEFDSHHLEGSYPRHITVTLALLPPNPDNLKEDYHLINRFDIISYYQWQDAFEYDEIFEFDDIFDAPPDSEFLDEMPTNPFEDTDQPLP